MINSLERNKKVKLTENKKRWIRLGYGIALSLMLAIVGILFITSCFSIYKSGSSPFTRESISRAFSKIAAWVYVTLSMVILGGVLSVAMPKEEGRLKGSRSSSVLVKRLSERVDLTSVDASLAAKINGERRLRRILGWGRVALITLSAILPPIYLLNPSNFPAVSGEYNSEILRGMLVYLAFLAPFFIYEIIYTVLSDLSYKAEHNLLKEAISVHGISAPNTDEPASRVAKAVKFIKGNEKPIILGVRIAFVGCAIAFIIAGICNGGMADVLNKAIKICTECIGLG